MKPLLLGTIALTVLTAAPAVTADSQLIASVRIGLTLVDNETTDNDFALSNFGSRIIWSGNQDLGNGLQGLGYLEFGFNPDDNARGSSGIDRTRQAWAGLSGDFGTVTIGAQYAAFYDLMSSHTDIAWWGSCWTQFECSRETQVLKYRGSSGDFSYAASAVAAANDDDNDAIDQIELGVNYSIAGYTLGVAVSSHADDVFADGSPNEGGTLVGLLASGSTGPVDLAITYQRADEDFANAADDQSHLTVSGTYGDLYGVFNYSDQGDLNPSYGTLGYTLNIAPSTLMYFEYQLLDDDTPNDLETIVRATLKYDWDVLQGS